MDMLVIDPSEQRRILASRADSQADRYDEVWDGVYIVSPAPNNEHQEIVGLFSYALMCSIHYPGLGRVLPGVNVSDRDDDWEHNYRCPDLAVFLNGTMAHNRGTHWLGGPDFLVEVVSRYDKSRDKLDFYAKVGSREVLILDRYPWSIELYQALGGRMTLVGKSTLDDPQTIVSEVLPLTFRLVEGNDRPLIAVVHADGVQGWSV